jgi:hypothetical protein
MKTALRRVSLCTAALLGLLLAPAPSLATQPLVLWEFYSCDTLGPGSSPGIVESVREVPALRDIHAFDSGVLKQRPGPETAEELVIRLDNGAVFTLTHVEPQGLRAGQRVRVVLTGSAARVKLDLPQCSSAFS